MPSVCQRIDSLLCALLFLPPLSVLAQDYPNKPIRLIVPYAAGGAGDIAFRLISGAVEEKLGQRFVIENKPGASGNIGAAEVARAAADGYTLLLGGGNNFTSNQFLYKNMGFDPIAVFDQIALISNSPTVVGVVPGVPVNTLRELAAYAKANPGKLNFGSPGVGTPPRLSAELFAALADVKMVHIPFNGSPAVMLALQQELVQLAFYTMGPVLALIRGGKLKPLAVASTSRLEALPGVPTSAEAGFPELLTGSWQGIAAPRGTDPIILDKINAAVRAALADQAVRKRFADMGAIPGDMSRGQLTAFVREEAARWKRVVDAAGIQPE
ncbi:MAG: tripartite tricarboxylate transporter substrate-binding protein [Proteobacteria bacterium]|nr:tripartite tricarboxylate transporter substrate-binding protein [Pseudomonadota bacterium]